MTCKATIFINQTKAARVQAGVPIGIAGYRGISESYYTDTEFNSQAQYDLVKLLMNKRAPMLPENATIVAFRLQEVDKLGKSVLYRESVAGLNGFIGDLSEVALKYRAHSATSAAERTITLAMVPDDIVIGGCYAPASNWQTNVNAFFTHLQNAPWKMKSIDQTQNAYPIATIDADGNVVTAEATNIVLTDKVQVLRSNDEQGVGGGGVYRLQAWTNASSFRLRGWNRGACTLGQIRKYVIEYVTLTVYPNNRTTPVAGTRKIGRPFDQSRGRASTRR